MTWPLSTNRRVENVIQAIRSPAERELEAHRHSVSTSDPVFSNLIVEALAVEVRWAARTETRELKWHHSVDGVRKMTRVNLECHKSSRRVRILRNSPTHTVIFIGCKPRQNLGRAAHIPRDFTAHTSGPRK